MEPSTTRYDAATVEQAVLALLAEMQALINLFERKGLLRPGEVSREILTMKNIAAGVTRDRRRRYGSGTGLTRPSRHAAANGNDGRAPRAAAPQGGGGPDDESHPEASPGEQRSP